MGMIVAASLCGAVLAGCVSTGPQMGAEELRARLSGQTVQMRIDGGAAPGEPEAFAMTFRPGGEVIVEPFGEQTATVRDGPVTLTIPYGFEGRWDVRDGQLCIGMQRTLDCQPATVSGDVLIVTDRDSGETARGRLRPAS